MPSIWIGKIDREWKVEMKKLVILAVLAVVVPLTSFAQRWESESVDAAVVQAQSNPEVWFLSVTAKKEGLDVAVVEVCYDLIQKGPDGKEQRSAPCSTSTIRLKKDVGVVSDSQRLPKETVRSVKLTLLSSVEEVVLKEPGKEKK